MHQNSTYLHPWSVLQNQGSHAATEASDREEGGGDERKK